MEKQKRIPRRRFREFLEAGEWEDYSFGSLVERKSTMMTGVSLPILEYEDLISGSGELNKDITQKSGNKTGIFFQEGDIVYGKLRPYLKNWYLPAFDGIAVGDFWVFRSQNIAPTYIYGLIQTPRYETVANQSIGTKMPRADWHVVSDTSFFVPVDYCEQKKIGNFFRRLDTIISLHQKKLAKLKDLKQAYLTEMFPAPGEKRPRRRFKGFSGDWEEKRLGDITESYSGGTPSVDVKKFYGGDIPFIRSAEINSDSTELYLTKDGFNSSSAKMVEKGCILYALYGATSGETGLSKIKGAINQAILAIIPHDGYDASFIMQWLRLNKGKIIETYLQGGQGNLSGNIVKDLVLDIPEYEEQKIIGKFVCNLDCLIDKAENGISKLLSLKQAYLAELFV